MELEGTTMDAATFLKAIFSDDEDEASETLPESLLRSTNCGRANCPVHGALNADESDLITDEELAVLTPAEAHEFALQIVAGAHNKLVQNQVSVAIILQKQADLWFRVAALLQRADDSHLDAKQKADAPTNKAYDASAATA